MTTAQVVAHVAQTVDWFMEGAFRPEGFDLDFEGHAQEVMKVQSLAEARAWLDRSFGAAIEKTATLSGAELMAQLPDGPVMGGAPVVAVRRDTGEKLWTRSLEARVSTTLINVGALESFGIIPVDALDDLEDVRARS